VRLGVDAVHRYLDPYGTGRRRLSASRQSESEQEMKDMQEAMKELGISFLGSDADLDDEGDLYLPDPLAKALARLLVEKNILTAEEVQKAFEDALDEEL